MTRHLYSLTVIALVCLFPVDPIRAESSAGNAAEAHLREALRNTMLQLRAADDERATLQSAQAQIAREKKALTQQVEALIKQGKSDRAASEATITGLKAKVADQDTEITRLKAAVEKWEADYKQKDAFARATESERARLAEEKIMLDRRIADQQVKNAALFKLGNEILVRYEKFGLGQALTAKEPFVGTARVKLETLVQDFQDKLSDQRIHP